ncbi:hypothetical protein ACJRO7_005262 [Eucalyptus globulus]|uniref:NPK1-activating kinesin-like protein C-terminal domain-containing protein n=1 Tax=Eucalyptus globulus TaxID=34317 RepID=A0ABD3J2C9_EUCGL
MIEVLVESAKNCGLAQKIWTVSRHVATGCGLTEKDVDQVADGAVIVAKLVGFVQPEEASTETFGLNFTPRISSTELHKWKSSMVSFL